MNEWMNRADDSTAPTLPVYHYSISVNFVWKEIVAKWSAINDHKFNPLKCRSICRIRNIFIRYMHVDKIIRHNLLINFLPQTGKNQQNSSSVGLCRPTFTNPINISTLLDACDAVTGLVRKTFTPATFSNLRQAPIRRLAAPKYFWPTVLVLLAPVRPAGVRVVEFSVVCA